ncbi:MAG TPA: hypothetical protein VGI19_02695 [Candidatus Cybelea sp.]|jgi:hypothetical protein
MDEEQKRKWSALGVSLDVTDIPIVSSNERFNEYELEDGTKLTVKAVATSFLRVDGQFTPDGRPVYLVTTNPIVTVKSSPVTRPRE